MRSHEPSPHGRLLAALATCLLAACSSDGGQTGVCASDAECTAPGTRCDVPAGRCVCASDEACGDNEFCNSVGVCQIQAGCSSNLDCKQADTYCDVASGQCLLGPTLVEGGTCGLASHCPFGTVCGAGGVCVKGCFDDGDCPLGVACFDGQCTPGICSGDDYCGYVEQCEDGACARDFRGPYCRSCSQRTAANPEPCDEPRNFCLINNRELGGFTNFCGVDCSLGQACPNGFSCSGVLILTQDSCFNTAQCQCNPNQLRFAEATCAVPTPCDPRRPDGSPDPDAASCSEVAHPDCNGGVAGPNTCVVPRGQTEGNCTCTTDDECADGSMCASGLCCSGTVRPDRECVGGEGTVSGFCTCSTDDDCPRDNCDGSRGACAISGRPCTPGNDDCGPIPCVEGACLIGQNCAPDQGLTCTEVLGGE